VYGKPRTIHSSFVIPMSQATVSKDTDAGRRSTFDLENLSCLEMLALEQSVDKRDWEKLWRYLPLIMR
jgi:hypothetical protein